MSTSPTLQPDPESVPQPAPVEPAQQRNWTHTVSGQQPAFVWAVAALLGIIVISASPRDTVVRLLLPVLVMFAYVFFGYPRESRLGAGLRSARVAQLADSSYFLGFLWTLWALIDSFVLRRTTGADTAFRVFGYALVTTASGMATRLYLLQFKYGGEEQIAEAEFTVEHNLQILSAVMQEASRSIQSFYTDMASLNARVEELSKGLDNVNQRFTHTHEETTKAIKDHIGVVVEDIRTSMKSPVQEYGRAIRAFTAGIDHQSRFLTETLQKSSGEASLTVKQAGEKFTAVIQETGQRIGQDHLELAKRFQGQSEQIIGQLHGLVEKLASVNLPAEGFNGFAQCLTELQRAIIALNGVLRPEGEIRASLSSFAEAVHVQGTAVGTALADVATRMNSIQVPAEITVDITEVKRAIEELEKAVEGLLQKAADQRWERAPNVASEAFLKLGASANSLRQTLDSTNASAKKIAVFEERPKKKRFWLW